MSGPENPLPSSTSSEAVGADSHDKKQEQNETLSELLGDLKEVLSKISSLDRKPGKKISFGEPSVGVAELDERERQTLEDFRRTLEAGIRESCAADSTLPEGHAYELIGKVRAEVEGRDDEEQNEASDTDETFLKPFKLAEPEETSTGMEECDRQAMEEFGKLGLSPEFVRTTVPGFEKLTQGQQLLLAEQMRQIANGRIEEEAERESTTKKGMEERDSDARNTWKVLRALQGIGTSFKRDALKESVEAGARNRTEKVFREDGEAVYGPILKQISMIMNVPGASSEDGAEAGAMSFPPEIDVDEKTGKLAVRFLSEREYRKFRRTEPSARIEGLELLALRRFNEAAHALSKMPQKWSEKDAKIFDRKRYERAERKYRESKNRIIGVIDMKSFDEDMFRLFSRMERDMRLMQHMSTDPDMGNFLGKTDHIIRNSRVLSFLKTNVVEKAGYFGLGWAGRALSAGVFGFVGAPVTAVVMGAGRAWGRAKKDLRAEKRAGQAGESTLPDREALQRERMELEARKDRNKREEKRFGALVTLLDIDKGSREDIVKAYAAVYGTGKTYIKAAEEPGAESPDDSGEAKHGLVWKLDHLVETARSADSGSDAEIGALKRLHARIAYTRRKLDEGLVDFSGGSGQVFNQMELLRALANAESAYGTLTRGENPELDRELESRLESFVDFQDEKMSEGRKQFIRKKVLWGAGISGSFAIAGALGRYFQEHWSGISEHASGFFRGGTNGEYGPNLGEFDGSESSVVAESTDPHISSIDRSMQPDVAPGGSTAKAPEGVMERLSGAKVFEVTAERGDGLTNLARKVAGEYLTAKGDPNLSKGLTAEHRVYIEDSIRRRMEFSGTLHPGDSVSVSRETIEEAIAEAKKLSPEQLRNLAPYADRVSAFHDLPRFEGEDVDGAGGGDDLVDVDFPGESPQSSPVSGSDASLAEAVDLSKEAGSAEDFVISDAVPGQRETIMRYLTEYPGSPERFSDIRASLAKGIRESTEWGVVNDTESASRALERLWEVSIGHRSTASIPEADRALGRLAVAVDEMFRGKPGFTDMERADRLLLPGSKDTFGTYQDRISMILLKAGVNPESIIRAMKRVSDENVIQWLRTGTPDSSSEMKFAA